MQLDIESMARVLNDGRYRDRIARDYGIVDPHASPTEFVRNVVDAFGQVSTGDDEVDPLDQDWDDRDVFRAAVWSLGSNSRNWITFKKRSDELGEALHGYDPVATNDAVTVGDLTVKRLTTFLPGSTGRKDAEAVALWARRLSDHPRYYDVICDVARSFNALNQEELDPEHLLPCVVSYFANPLAGWPGEQYLTRAKEIPSAPDRKFPGMGHALGSEFLRNLHWSGFKPDIHITRLFNAWLTQPELRQLAENERYDQLLSLVHQNNEPVRTYLLYALAGVALTPPGTRYTVADNIVWLLGYYVERKGKESGRDYIKR